MYFYQPGDSLPAPFYSRSLGSECLTLSDIFVTISLCHLFQQTWPENHRMGKVWKDHSVSSGPIFLLRQGHPK